MEQIKRFRIKVAERASWRLAIRAIHDEDVVLPSKVETYLRMARPSLKANHSTLLRLHEALVEKVQAGDAGPFTTQFVDTYPTLTALLAHFFEPVQSRVSVPDRPPSVSDEGANMQPRQRYGYWIGGTVIVLQLVIIGLQVFLAHQRQMHHRVNNAILLKNEFRTEAMQQRRAALSARLVADPQAVDLDDTVLAFFEDIGHLALQDLISEEDLWTMFSYEMVNYWFAARHYIDQVRAHHGEEALFEQYEQVVQGLIDEEAAEAARPIDALYDQARVRHFLEMEMLRAQSSSPSMMTRTE